MKKSLKIFDLFIHLLHMKHLTFEIFYKNMQKCAQTHTKIEKYTSSCAIIL